MFGLNKGVCEAGIRWMIGELNSQHLIWCRCVEFYGEIWGLPRERPERQAMESSWEVYRCGTVTAKGRCWIGLMINALKERDYDIENLDYEEVSAEDDNECL